MVIDTNAFSRPVGEVSLSADWDGGSAVKSESVQTFAAGDHSAKTVRKTERDATATAEMHKSARGDEQGSDKFVDADETTSRATPRVIKTTEHLFEEFDENGNYLNEFLVFEVTFGPSSICSYLVSSRPFVAVHRYELVLRNCLSTVSHSERETLNPPHFSEAFPAEQKTKDVPIPGYDRAGNPEPWLAHIRNRLAERRIAPVDLCIKTIPLCAKG